jgi:hypothetical protein
MGVISTQNITYRLIANGQQLDVFEDEDLKISNNVTGLFDIGTLPSDFTRQITLPGTKLNNAFFEHVYDISIENPYLFATNVKVPCYLDFNGVYLINGYLQLNKVNMFQSKAVDSYEVTIFGTLSSFGKIINNTYLTDLSSLSKYNHTSSLANISASWEGNLFNGDIVYPFADYGTGIQFVSGDDFAGIDNNQGALNVQDFKPAIRVKAVLDSIFEEAGYTYSSSFFNKSWVKDMYMICNYGLKYPEYSGVDLENYGVVKIGPISGSGMTDLNIPNNTVVTLPWYNTFEDKSQALGTNNSYLARVDGPLTAVLNLNFNVSCSVNNGPGTIELHYWPTGSTPGGSGSNATTLVNFNQYFQKYWQSRSGGINQTFELSSEVYIGDLDANTYYYFGIKMNEYFATTDPVITLDPGATTKSYLNIKKVNYAADNRVIDIPSNMPYATTGIKQIDFIIGLQRKFHLVIYPDKTKPNHFIIETFNNWYNKTRVVSFNDYIDLNQKWDVIPANNLAVNKLNFGDTLDQDYISQQFSKAANREYGKIYYTDTTNFYSQGTLDVKTTFASSPLIRIPGTGLSGSVGGIAPSVTCYNYVSQPIPVPNTMTWLNCAGVLQTQYIPPMSTINLGCGIQGSHSGPVTQGTTCS